MLINLKENMSKLCKYLLNLLANDAYEKYRKNILSICRVSENST